LGVIQYLQMHEQVPFYTTQFSIIYAQKCDNFLSQWFLSLLAIIFNLILILGRWEVRRQLKVRMILRLLRLRNITRLLLSNRKPHLLQRGAVSNFKAVQSGSLLICAAHVPDADSRIRLRQFGLFQLNLNFLKAVRHLFRVSLVLRRLQGFMPLIFSDVLWEPCYASRLRTFQPSTRLLWVLAQTLVI